MYYLSKNGIGSKGAIGLGNGIKQLIQLHQLRIEIGE